LKPAAPLLVNEEDLEHREVLTPGQQFGSYEILDALGAGGMGEVYLARIRGWIERSR
jgi:serine/threonine protein kinase